jgi:anti-sigma28 factor (negative regulator of flagellin synthesis)
MQACSIREFIQLSRQPRLLERDKLNLEGPERAAEADTVAKGDTLTLSGDAREKAKIADYVKMVKEMPGIREDKVAEAKRKLASGDYNRPEMAEKIAERLLEG